MSQFQAGKLKERAKSALDRLPNPEEDSVRLRILRGGNLVEEALGAARIDVDGSWKRLKNPAVEIMVENAGEELLRLKTSPARAFFPERRSSPTKRGLRVKTEHLSRGGQPLIFLPAQGTGEWIVERPYEPDDHLGREPYPVPAAATHVKGEGVLVWAYGPRASFKGERPVKRNPSQPGPAQCYVLSSSVPQFKVAGSWISAPDEKYPSWA